MSQIGHYKYVTNRSQQIIHFINMSVEALKFYKFNRALAK